VVAFSRNHLPDCGVAILGKKSEFGLFCGTCIGCCSSFVYIAKGRVDVSSFCVATCLGRRDAGDPQVRPRALPAAGGAAGAGRTRLRLCLSMSAAVFVRDPEARTANAVEAIKAFQAALEILPSDRDPMTWAQTQDNLGNAQTALAESQGDCEGKMPILTFAVDAYGKALTKEMREDLEWAKTQNNLGNALGMLAECEIQTARLRDAAQSRFEKALQAFDEALKERTREHVPLDWAGTQVNMANAYVGMGLQENNESGTYNLKQAITRYRNALEVWTPDRTRLLWIKTQTALAQTLTLLGHRTNDTEPIREAQTHVRTIEESCTKANDTPQCLDFVAHLSAALASMK